MNRTKSDLTELILQLRVVVVVEQVDNKNINMTDKFYREK